MTHDSYRELIQRELDDDLSSEELALLETHVATCANCRREREEFAELADGLSRLRHLMPERSLVPMITPNILPEKQKQAARRISPLWWRGLSVAAVVVLAIGWSTQWKFGQGSHLAGHRQTPAAPQQVALLPSTSPGQGQSVTSGQQTTATATSGNGTTASQAETKQEAPSVLESVTALLRQSLFGTPASKRSLSSVGSTKPSQPTLLADASNGLTTQTIVPGSSHPVAPLPSSKDNGSGTGNGTASDAGNGNLTSDTGSNTTGPSTTGTNTGTDPSPAPTPSPLPTPPPVVTQPTPSGGGGYKHSFTGGQNTIPTDNSAISVTSISDTFTADLQQQVDNDEDKVMWALDSVQVVRRCLHVLGFSENAVVTPTNSPERVHVLQGSVQYEVLLDQPFEQGAAGIWEPQQVARAIDPKQPISYEKPIIAYFNKITANHIILAHQPVYVVRYAASGRVIVTVMEEHSQNGLSKWVNVKYVFNLKKTPDQNWVLDGDPMTL